MFSDIWHLYLFGGFKTIILWSVHPKWFVFLLNYDSLQLQLESWNRNHESLNRTQQTKKIFCKWLESLSDLKFLKNVLFYLNIKCQNAFIWNKIFTSCFNKIMWFSFLWRPPNFSIFNGIFSWLKPEVFNFLFNVEINKWLFSAKYLLELLSCQLLS